MAAAWPDIQDFLTSAPKLEQDEVESEPSLRKGARSFDDAIEYIGFGPFQWKLVFLCGFVWAADAMELMLLTFILPRVKEDWRLSKLGISTIGAMSFVGMLCGSYAWGVIADRFGRRTSMLASVATTFVFGIMSAVATGPVSLTVLRSLVGFGIGGTSIAFSLLTEYVPLTHRGVWLIGVQGSFWSLGVLLESTLAWAIIPTQGWRCLLVVSSLPMLLLLVMHWFLLPESARWLAVRGQEAQAQHFLREVGVINGQPLGQNFQLRLITKAKDANLSMLFSTKLSNLTSFVWALWPCLFFVYFGCVLFTDTLFSKQTDWSVYAVALVTSIAEIPGLLVALLLVDYKGRCKTMAVLFVVCAASLCFLSGMARFPTGLLILFMFCVRGAIYGAYVTAYVYTAEVYPTSCRTTGLGAASAMGRVGGILTIYVAISFSTSQLIVPVLMFVVVACVAAFLAMRLPFETKQQKLADVDHDLKGRDKPGEDTHQHGDL